MGFSTNKICIGHGLPHIKVHCHIIDTSNNIFNGSKADVLPSLPITTTQSLKVSVQHIFDIESKLLIQKKTNIINQDNIATDVGKILMEFYIM